jgi:hypothetical protein
LPDGLLTGGAEQEMGQIALLSEKTKKEDKDR